MAGKLTIDPVVLLPNLGLAVAVLAGGAPTAGPTSLISQPSEWRWAPRARRRRHLS